MAFAAGLIASTSPEPARAQGQDGEFSVQRFEPEPGPRNFMSVAGGRTDGAWTWSAGLMFDYQRDPFVVQSCVSATTCADPNAQQPEDVSVISDMLTWNVLASITPHPIIQIGLRVPVAYVSGQGIDFATGKAAPDGIAAAGLGDVALEGKLRFLGEPSDPVVLAAALDVAAPLGHATSEGHYIGNATPITVGLRAIADVQLGGFSAAANLRGIYRKDATFADTTIGPEFRWGAAAGYRVHQMFRPLVEGFGATRFSGINGTNSLEILGGVQVFPWAKRLMLTFAGGTGLIKGVGVPMARGVFGLSFNYEQVDDDDGDGVDNDADQCPTKAEDRDGVADEDGCPEDDFDHDNVLDEVDNCPLKAETDNGYKDDDGCPDTAADKDGDGVWDEADKCPDKAGKMRRPEWFGCPDSDKDGVADRVDKCNGQVEDTDGFEDTDGCPDPDNDGDGVLDAADECSDQAEIVNGVKDGDGCPDFGPDADNDGIDDSKDRCSKAPENYNGNADTDGCPDAGGALAIINPKEIRAKVPIRFAGDAIRGAASTRALDAIAAGLNNWSAISKVEILVTTTVKNAAHGKARAAAVLAHLTGKGVAAARLTTKTTSGAKGGVSFKVLEAPAWGG